MNQKLHIGQVVEAANTLLLEGKAEESRAELIELIRALYTVSDLSKEKVNVVYGAPVPF